jgi:DNA-directed RNA polymerase delta subunit
MVDYQDINPNLSEVDIAYKILKAKGEALNFRELMQLVFSIKNSSMDNPQLLAAVHTQLNLDNRFSFFGQGNWGLREWSQSKVVRRNIYPSSAGRLVVRRRSLQDEIESEDGEYNDYEKPVPDEDDDDWEE